MHAPQAEYNLHNNVKFNEIIIIKRHLIKMLTLTNLVFVFLSSCFTIHYLGLFAY